MKKQSKIANRQSATVNRLTQRDAFWNTIYDAACVDHDIVVVSADMGAPALDQFRRNIAAQFVNVGIAEQNAITVAAGLAMSGKKPFAYAIAPFITLRCLEQIRIENAIMKIPVTLVGVGAGLGYDDSGPTHHLLEDLAVMRAFPNITIYSLSDAVMARAVAKTCCAGDRCSYVRMEREVFPDLYAAAATFDDGLALLRPGGDLTIVSTGAMLHTALMLADELAKKKVSVAVVDAYRFPLNAPLLVRMLADTPKVVTLEEHFLPGGLGSAVVECLSDAGVAKPVHRIGMTHEQGYAYRYTRAELRRFYALDDASLMKRVAAFAKS